MGLIHRRWASSMTSTATKDVAMKLLSQAHNLPSTRRQLIDANQLQRLSLTLSRPNLYTDLSVDDECRGPPAGTPLPPGYHLAYFTPALLQRELGQDGADISYNPPAPFTRRMWAGGKLTWNKVNLLRVGDEIVESTRLVSSEPKRTRSGEEMIVAGVEKSFENSNGPVLVDRRDWVFRHPLASAQQYPEPAGDQEHLLPKPDKPSVKSRDFLQTPISLFRFSAVTFNAHMIHYSKSWCRETEGHPELVVHGPLNMINMLDFWRDEKGEAGYSVPNSMQYRATAPFYAGEKYRALYETGNGDTHIRLWASDRNGNVRMGMMGDIID